LINEEKVKQAKLILVTAITPTPAGEGKTTTSIGLNEGLNKLLCMLSACTNKVAIRSWRFEHLEVWITWGVDLPFNHSGYTGSGMNHHNT
jgi:hypothetical protein